MHATAERFSKSFVWLNITQFLGALNDNIFKLLAMFFIIAQRGPADAARVMGIGGAAFVLPFLLFSAGAGVLADRHSKRNIIVLAKALEILVMLAGLLAFGWGREIALYAVIFLMSSQSALFGPSKYGIVPELVGREQLSRANSLLVMFTYLAIIVGSVAAPFIAQISKGNYPAAQMVCVLVAAAGFLSALPIGRTEPAGTTRTVSVRFVSDIWRTLWSIREDRYLLMAVMASAYFTLIGAFMQLNIIPYGMQYLGLSQESSAYLFFLAAVGIAAGAFVAGRMSGRNIELGVVPIGALLLTVSVMALRGMRHLWDVAPMIFVAGVGAGMFIVPLDAFVQFRAPAHRRGEVLAASAFLGWVGVLIASAIVYVMGVFHLDAGTGFLLMGLMTLVLTIAALRVLPDFLLRFIGVVITRIVYRIRVLGAENVPVEGGALLVCNHVSWVDALLLLATQQRRIRFLMERSIYETPILRPLFRLMGVIPISTADSPKKVIASLREARKALDEGFLVCIFAEGAITRTGMMHGFRSGFEHIVKDSPHPILPVYIGGAWGSIFSFYYGRPLAHWPTMLRYPVTVLFGKPMPPTTAAGEAREAVMELSCEYYNDRKATRLSLGETFVQVARQNWRRRAIADTTGKNLTFGMALTGALALAEKLEPLAQGQEMVGVLLPPSVGGVLSNVALTLAGKVPVNLNYTASDESFRSAVEQCRLQRVITSRVFLEKLGRFQNLEQAVFLEDLLGRIGDDEKRRAWLKARFAPRRWLARLRGFTADALATVIFSSGSTGTPKGVMLSHHNILSNVESIRAVFHFSSEDCICAALPFFHSFGSTCSLWLPLLCGFAAVYHSNPLDGAKIAEIVREHRATLLFATPTFLLAYLRRAEPEDFASLRYVIAGAEKLKPRVADAFEDRFGVRPLEGYGATELAPVATLSIPDVEALGVRQVGAKPGSVGHPLPGVAVKVVDPETGQRMPAGQAGVLLIKGPNVMLGYLNNSAKTAEVLRDGWYNTGDIAVVDKDGFVAITDRLSRFSKIGGEMVPHVAVEEAYHKGLGKTEQVLVVTSVPDEKKGEKLVVLYTDEAGDVARLQQIIKESNLPNLWKPGPDAYYRIESIPLLGSGKLDLKAVKERAMNLAAHPKA
jgi:acyl-[acyl-carrier-protein]-phospholipid O-acyltransferase/long-chain-fatty-acid--[acyl-carrier-protein] ligase